jgi:pimeloyl-ACP methyl ester carboxylesterase
MKILHSRVLGEGSPLVILHGFLGMGDNWKTLANKFAENYEVHLVDQRNHGRSFHSDEFSLEILVEDLWDYIAFHKLDTINLLGHSMGGKVAMLFASKYPERIQKLLIADISPRKYPAHHQDILTALNAVDFKIQSSREEIEKVLERYIPQHGVRQFLMKNITRVDKDTYKYRFNLQSITEDYHEITIGLPSEVRYDGETLFLRGDTSGYIGIEDEILIHNHFPNTEIVTVINSGHWLHADNPIDFYNEVVSFLD